MPARSSRWLFALLLLLGCLTIPARADSSASASTGPESAPFRRQDWLLPSPVPRVLMHAILFRPPGAGPFPLAVINHGSDEDPIARARMAMPDFPALTAWLVGRGYAVLLPERPGNGATGGPYLEEQGWCGAPDYVEAGKGAARSIAAAIDDLDGQSFIRGKALVIGNSAGGWGALALAADNSPNVAAVINFAGGRGGRQGNKADTNCAPDRLIAAAATFGQTARLPTLWLYAQNDTFFPPTLSKQMADAFAAAGGHVEYHLLPPVRGDGHALIETAGAEATWMPYLAAFLSHLPRGR